MKKLTTIIIALLFVLNIMPLHIHANECFGVKKGNCIIEDSQYKITLEKMFLEEDFPKIEKLLLQNDAPFKVLIVDYKSKTLLIEMTKRATFDDIKQAIDKLGLRITNKEVVK